MAAGVETRRHFRIRGGGPVTFCPSNPDTREYVIALFTDIAANYDVDYIQTCQWLFNDKDTDCWRWRTFENIRVNKGDGITLIGKADQKERARLDYIEFIRCVD